MYNVNQPGAPTGVGSAPTGPGGGAGYVNGPVRIVLATSQLTSDKATGNDHLIEVDASGGTGAFAEMLPPAAQCIGRKYIVKKIDASSNAVNVSDPSSTIDGAAQVALSARWAFVAVQSDGNQWSVIGH